MQIKKLHIAFFSPTHSTRNTLRNITKGIAAEGVKEVEFHNLTLPAGREKPIEIPEDELLLIGMPVYGGRVPGMFQAGINITGKGPAVCVAVYGNRHYDDALLELTDLTTEKGFHVIAGAAFIAQHSLNPVMAAGRPDIQDIRKEMDFGKAVIGKLAAAETNASFERVEVKGNPQYKPYNPVIFAPQLIRERCISCRICAGACPVQIINYDDFTVADPSKCIFCIACVTFCPRDARSISQPEKEMFEARMAQLAGMNAERKEPEIFI